MQIWILLVRAFSYLQLHTEKLQTSTEKLPFGLNKRRCGGEGISSWTSPNVWVSVDLSKLIISDKVAKAHALIEYSTHMSQNSFVISIATEVSSWTGEFIVPNNKLPLCSRNKTLLKLFGIHQPLKQTAAVSLQTLCSQHKPIAYYDSDGITTTPFQFFFLRSRCITSERSKRIGCFKAVKCFHCLCWWGRQIRAKNTAINGWVYGGTPAVCGARSFI